MCESANRPCTPSLHARSEQKVASMIDEIMPSQALRDHRSIEVQGLVVEDFAWPFGSWVLNGWNFDSF
jgi:hypothetical protein